MNLPNLISNPSLNRGNYMKNIVILSLGLVCILSTAWANLPIWTYDAGPNPKTKMGKELIDLVSQIPDMPRLSVAVMGVQKFRPAYGPVPWRMLQEENKVKILFIGQDATHIAEAAGRPATAGFGGRAQDLAAYFGVNEGAAFINTYAYTIQGQYGAYGTPYVLRSASGNSVRFSNLVDNGLWLISQDQDSSLVKWRNANIDWIIRNNKKSLKLIVTFGGAARDAIASFVESKGAIVEANNKSTIKSVQIPMTKLVYAGGNNQFPILIDREGKDLYSKMIGRKLDYSKISDQEAAQKDLKDNFENYMREMIFTQKGPMRNGIFHPAQLGGYDLDQIKINNKKTRSLKGITLNDRSVITNDLLVVELPHPTALSNMKSPAEASKAVAEKLKVLAPYVKSGWRISPDPDQVNSFAEGKAYAYRRADIGPEYYDYGTPGTRMVPVSTASRMSGNPHVIIFGTREKAKFDMNEIKLMTEAHPAEGFSEEEIFTNRPRSLNLRYTFDPGPGEFYARMMKERLDFKKIFAMKDGMSFKANGIDAYYVKTHPDIGDFGHYRGTFNKARVVVLADPHGNDDLVTARALTGTRGQYLQGFMNDLSVNDNYLVIKTVPFGMDGATDKDWDYILKATERYRSDLLESVLKDNNVTFVIADGKYAQKVVKNLNLSSPVMNLNRSSSHSEDMKNLGKRLKISVRGEMANIPRSHLSFYARTWEGTSGDRILNASDKFRGLAFAEVAPEWAWGQKINSIVEDISERKLINKIEKNNFPMPGESIPKYLRRLNIDSGLSEEWGKAL